MRKEKNREVLKLGGWSSACFFLCPPSRLQRSRFAPFGAHALCLWRSRFAPWRSHFVRLTLRPCPFGAQPLCKQDVHKISPRFAQDITKVCPRYAQDFGVNNQTFRDFYSALLPYCLAIMFLGPFEPKLLIDFRLCISALSAYAPLLPLICLEGEEDGQRHCFAKRSTLLRISPRLSTQFYEDFCCGPPKGLNESLI